MSISLRNVGMRYGNADSGFWALKGVDLDVADFEFVAVLGPSGCGKTTLLKLLAGLNPPVTGTIAVDGRPITGPGPDRAVVFQDFVLLPWSTVMQNVAFGLRMRRLPRRQREERARAQIARVGLSGFEQHYPYELSGGMQQRVGLARALAVEPTIMLMDEPFGALDALTRQFLQADLLRIWQQERKTVLFVTHGIDEAVYLADRIVVMGTRPGRVLEIVDVDLPRPREDDIRRAPEFHRLTDHLWGILQTAGGLQVGVAS